MSYASRKGYRGERAVELLMTDLFPDRPILRPRAGSAQDVGDLVGLPLVTSVKHCARMELHTWCDELSGMVSRTPFHHGAVWHHRRGHADPLGWYVTMPGYLYVPALEAYVRQETR